MPVLPGHSAPLAISAKAASRKSRTKAKGNPEQPQPDPVQGGKRRKVDEELAQLNLKRQLMMTMRSAVDKVEEWRVHVLEQLECSAADEFKADLQDLRALLYQRLLSLQKFVPDKFRNAADGGGEGASQIQHRWSSATKEFSGLEPAPCTPTTSKLLESVSQRYDSGDTAAQLEKDIVKKFADKFKNAVSSVATASTSLTTAIEETQDFHEKQKGHGAAPVDDDEAEAEESEAGEAEGEEAAAEVEEEEKDKVEDDEDDGEGKGSSDELALEDQDQAEHGPESEAEEFQSDAGNGNGNDSDGPGPGVADGEVENRLKSESKSQSENKLYSSMTESFASGQSEGGCILQEYPKFTNKTEMTAFSSGWESAEEVTLKTQDLENDKFLKELLKESAPFKKEKRTKTWPDFTKARGEK